MTREERIELSRRKQTSLRARVVIIGLACVICASVRMYLYGYRDNGFTTYFSYALLYIGWITLLVVFGLRFFDSEKIVFKNDSARWLKLRNIPIFIVFAFLLIGNIVLVNYLANERTERILTTEPTGNTVAIVTVIETRNTLTGPRPYARFEYVVNGATVIKGLYNYSHQYVVGKKYAIIYSIEHPQMIRINPNAVL